jgi:hypothetical protein
VELAVSECLGFGEATKAAVFSSDLPASKGSSVDRTFGGDIAWISVGLSLFSGTSGVAVVVVSVLANKIFINFFSNVFHVTNEQRVFI